MKKILLFLMLVMALPMTAQKTAFPKKGFNIKWIKRTNNGFDNYSCSIKKFEDSDTLYYISFVSPGMPPYSICFTFLGESTAEQIAAILKDLGKWEKKKWIMGYLRKTGAYQVSQTDTYNDCWTFFKPKATEREITKHFNLAAAIYAYHRDRDRDKRWASITPEQWMALYSAAKIVLPLVGPSGRHTSYEEYINPYARNRE